MKLIIPGITRSATLDTICVKPLQQGLFDILEVSHENVKIPPKKVEPIAADGVEEEAQDKARADIANEREKL